MRTFNFRLGIIAAGFALIAAPVMAQRPNESGGGGPAGDRGTAVDRPATSGSSGGGTASVGGGGSVVGGVGSSTISSSPSAGGASSPSFSSADRGAPMAAEPQRRNPSGGERRGGDRAVPRGSGSSDNSGTSRSGGTTTASSPGTNDNSSEPHDRAVPSWSRPRGDRPVTGTAVERTTPPIRNGGVIIGGRYYDPYYLPFGFGYPGYGLGLGYVYDPWYDPWGLGYGAGYGSYYPYSYGAQGYGYGYGQGSSYSSQDEGAIRLKVKPRDAKVYVDGYFVGVVDNFDGTFQKLKLPGGHHQVEVRTEGYETAPFDVLITPGQTVTYEGELKRIR